MNRKKSIEELFENLKSNTGVFEQGKQTQKKSYSLPVEQETMLKEHLSLLEREYAPKCKSVIERIIDESQAIVESSSVAIMPYQDVINKMGKEDIVFGDIYNTIFARICVAELMDLSKLMKAAQSLYGDDLLMVENFFQNHKDDSPYRAIHLVLKIDDIACFELKIMTARESVFSEVYRAIVENPEFPIPEEIKTHVTGLYWGLQKELLEKYMKELKIQ